MRVTSFPLAGRRLFSSRPYDRTPTTRAGTNLVRQPLPSPTFSADNTHFSLDPTVRGAKDSGLVCSRPFRWGLQGSRSLHGAQAEHCSGQRYDGKRSTRNRSSNNCLPAVIQFPLSNRLYRGILGANEDVWWASDLLRDSCVRRGELTRVFAPMTSQGSR